MLFVVTCTFTDSDGPVRDRVLHVFQRQADAERFALEPAAPAEVRVVDPDAVTWMEIHG